MNRDHKQVVSVSVIIPCYNCENTIIRAVQSIVQQTWLPKEIILVNDASTDKTKDVIKNIQQEHGRSWIKVLTVGLNSGPSIARNKGINQAISKYIAFLDADDSWHPQKLEIQYFWMQAHPNEVLTGHKIALYEEMDSYPIKKEEVIAKKISKLGILHSNPFSTPTVMMQSKLKVKFDFEQRYAEDYLFWLNVYFNFGSVYRLENELAYMHKGAYGQGGLSNNLIAMEKGELATYSKIYKSKNITCLQYLYLLVFSLAKFVRRVFLIRVVKRLM